MTQKSFVDHRNYRDMSEPFESQEEFAKALDSFWADLYELRNKHRIADIVMAVHGNYKLPDGEYSGGMLMLSIGDELKVESLAAFAYGQAASKRQEFIGRIMDRYVKHPGHKK